MVWREREKREGCNKEIQRYGEEQGDNNGARKKKNANAEGPKNGKKGEGKKGKKEEETNRNNNTTGEHQASLCSPNNPITKDGGPIKHKNPPKP